MTIYRVWHASTDGTKDGSTWAKAFTSIAHATVLAATGGTDTIWVASDHDEEQNAPTNVSAAFTGGTQASPLCIYSVDRSDDSYAPGASIETDGGNITVTGNICAYGLDWYANGATRDLNIGTLDNTMIFSDGTLRADDDFNISSGTEMCIEFRNCTVICNNATPPLNVGDEVRVVFRDCVVTHSTTDAAFYPNDNTHILLEDCDLSADSDYIALPHASGRYRCSVIARRCKLKSGSGIFDPTNALGDTYTFGLVESSSSATDATPFGLTKYQDYYGTIEADSSRYRTGGASNGVNSYGWRFVANTNTREFHGALRSPPIVRWVAGGSEITVTVYVATDGVTLQNDECWIELRGPDDTATSTTRGYVLTTKPGASATLPFGDPLESPANLTADAVSSWEGSGVGTMQKMSITYTPDQAGPLSVVVCVAKAAGVTVNVDPKLEVT